MKIRKTKKQPKFGFFRSKYFILAEALVLLVLVVIATRTISPTAVISADIAVPLPSVNPAPTTSPSPSPENFGKSIRVPILTYHYIGENQNPDDRMREGLSVNPELFEEQLSYLAKEGYNPIDLDTLLAGLSGAVILPPKPVVITFDDGYADLYVNAFPILKKYNFKAVAFIPTGLIDTTYYASWDQLAEMHQSGLVSMQAHSVNHLSLVTTSPETLTNELTTSKIVLEERFGRPVNFMAYPYGTSNPAVWEAAKKAGFLGALGTWSSPIISEGVIFNMPRLSIRGNTNLSTFISKL